MMTKAGRLALVKSVLMAIPLHQIVVLGLNKKALKQIEKIVRGFLWAGRQSEREWRPLPCQLGCVSAAALGSLGVPDLARTAVSLRMRWLWRMRADPLRPWRGIDMHFSYVEREVLTSPQGWWWATERLPFYG
jgi:hypothetical protein